MCFREIPVYYLVLTQVMKVGHIPLYFFMRHCDIDLCRTTVTVLLNEWVQNKSMNLEHNIRVRSLKQATINGI